MVLLPASARMAHAAGQVVHLVLEPPDLVQAARRVQGASIFHAGVVRRSVGALARNHTRATVVVDEAAVKHSRR